MTAELQHAPPKPDAPESRSGASLCSTVWLGRVLVACEYSGTVRDAFAALGWDAWSCDLLPSEMHDVGGYRTRLVVKLLYGCGLRVSEPLNLRIKDVCLSDSMLIIRDAKGGKDRRVAIPCSLVPELKQQIEKARVMWQQDASNGVPVMLPGQLARKYPRSALAWQWYWLFPAHQPCLHPRTKQRVRWRMHEVNVQRCVKAAAIKAGLDGTVTPHHLRHAFATHAMQAGAYVRDIQITMGHAHLETTMGYLTPEKDRVVSPLETL